MKDTKIDNGKDKNSVLYYENMEGGHGGAADSKQQAVAQALIFTSSGRRWGAGRSKWCSEFVGSIEYEQRFTMCVQI